MKSSDMGTDGFNIKNIPEVQKGLDSMKKELAKEATSAQTLGAMKPQGTGYIQTTGYHGSAIGSKRDLEFQKSVQKGGTTMEHVEIPDVLVEFVTDPEKNCDMYVLEAFTTVAEEFKVNRLPGKVKKLTIERAVLKTKISLIKHLPKSAGKVDSYKKRLVDIERALRKINASLQSDAERKEMDKEIKKLDKEVSRKTAEKIKNKELVESVNAIFEEMQKDDPAKPMTQFMLTESMVNYLLESVDDLDDELFAEGANLELNRQRKSHKKAFKSCIKDMKRCFKNHDLPGCKDAADKAQGIIDDFKKVMEDYPTYSATANTLGMMMGDLGFFVTSCIAIVTLFATLGPMSAGFTALLSGLVLISQFVAGFKANNEYKKKSKGFTASPMNHNFNKAIQEYDKMRLIMKKFRIKLNKFEFEEEKREKRQMDRDMNKKLKEANDIVSASKLTEESVFYDDEYLSMYLETEDGLELLKEAVSYEEMSEELMTEGANLRLTFDTRTFKKEFRTLTKKLKKQIRREELADAKKTVADINRMMADFQKQLDKFPEDGLTTFCGFMLGLMLFIGNSIMSVLKISGAGTAVIVASDLKNIRKGMISNRSMGLAMIAAPLVSVAANVRDFMDIVTMSISRVNQLRRAGKDINTSILNMQYSRCCREFDKMKQAMSKLEDKLEAASKGDVTKEYVEYNVFDEDYRNYVFDTEEDPVSVLLESFEMEAIADELITEGANLTLTKNTHKYTKQFKGYIKDAKKALRKKDIDACKEAVSKANDVLDDFQNELNDFPQDAGTSICGALMGTVLTLIECALVMLAAFAAIFTLKNAKSDVIIGTKLNLAKGTITNPDGTKADQVGTMLRAERFVDDVQLSAALSGWIGVITGIKKTVSNMITSARQNERTGGVKNASGMNVQLARCARQFDKMRKIMNDFERKLNKVKVVEVDTSMLTESSITSESADLLPLARMYQESVIDRDDLFDFLMEAVDPDDGLKDILAKLNKKGYKTKYSCSGHKKSFKEDRNDDGIVNGKLSSRARIMFDGDYDFPDPPKYWGWKTVEGKDYLYVLPVSHNSEKDDPKEAFDAWKNKYMSTLKNWVDSLKDASTSNDVVTKDDAKKEDDVTESAAFESVDDLRSLDDMMMDELALLGLEF